MEPPSLVAAGYFLRPLGEYVGEVVRDRREEGKRKARFQYESLLDLAEALQAWKSAGSMDIEGIKARARWESLNFRIADEDLRATLERLMVDQEARQSDEYGNVLRRLGGSGPVAEDSFVVGGASASAIGRRARLASESIHPGGVP